MADSKIIILWGFLAALVAGVAFLFERRLINMEKAFLNRSVVRIDGQKEIADQVVSALQMEIKKYQESSTMTQEQTSLTLEHLEKLKAFFMESVIENSFQLQKAFLDKRCDVKRDDQKEIADRVVTVLQMEIRKNQNSSPLKPSQEQTTLTLEHLEKLKAFFMESVIEGSFNLQKAFLDKRCDVKRDDQKEIADRLVTVLQMEMKKNQNSSTLKPSQEQMTLTLEHLEKLKAFFMESVLEGSFKLQKAFLDKRCDVKRDDQKEIADRLVTVLQMEMKKNQNSSTLKPSQEQMTLTLEHLEKLNAFFMESVIENSVQLQKAFLDKRCDVKRDDQKEITDHVMSVLELEMKKYQNNATKKPSQEGTPLTLEHLENLKSLFVESVIESGLQLQKAFLDKRCDVKRDDQKEITDHIVSVLEMEMKKNQNSSTPKPSQEQTPLTLEHLDKVKAFFIDSVNEAIKYHNSIKAEKIESGNPDTEEKKEEGWLSWIFMILNKTLGGLTFYYCLCILSHRYTDRKIQFMIALYITTYPFTVQPSAVLPTFFSTEYAYTVDQFVLGLCKVIWASASLMIIKDMSYI